MIKLIEIYKHFDNNVIFDNLSISFNDHTTYGIVGPNGKGKSVLLNIIVGFVKPNHGKVIIDEKTLDDNFSFIPNSGITINHPDFLPNLTGDENLHRLALISNTDINVIDELSKRLNFDINSKIKYKNYSTGMKQKLRLIQALMDKPNYLFLDEPFNGLDEETIKAARKIIIEYKNVSNTIFLTSHNQEDIEIVCDEVININDLVVKGY